MKCHYDVLSVARDAEDAEIKKSYRKLALLYHPDKNTDNVEEVTELFREVQSAYDVLSDPQERAWYDKHREAILRGGDDYVEDCLDLMHYFNPRVFCGFDDGTSSFYTVFRDAFSKLAKEDEAFIEDEDLIVPEFGFSYSDYETVVRPFYIYWLAYYTKKSFVWKEKYDIRQAANRPTQRLMEKENKKLRDACRKKRNEEVRALVSYVRKRDKRVIEEIKKNKLKQEEQQRKTIEKREMQKIDRSKMLDNYEEQEWMAFDASKLDDIDSHFDNQFGTVGDDSDSDYDVLYCIACDKNFKSDKALANHEKSKKHKENVQLIKNELDADLFDELCLVNDKRNSNNEEADETNENVEEFVENDSFLPRLSSINLPENVVKRNVIEKNTKSGEDYSLANSKKSKQKKKKRALLSIEEDLSDDSESKSPETTEGENSKIEVEEVNDKNSEHDSLEEGDSNIKSINDEVNIENVDPPDGDSNLEDTVFDLTTEESDQDIKPTGKAKKNKKTDNPDEVTGSFQCEVCTKVFPTRNKLFKHIKSEGHAQFKEDTKKVKKGKGKKK